jgi:ribonuclease BN (tRNA processing enzyme)
VSDRIVLLGTGTCQLQPRRIASSVLIEVGDLRVLFDLGRGVADRLAARGLRQDDIEHVILSHFHPDHLSDLVPYLHAASHSRIDPRSRDLHLYGPPGLTLRVQGILDAFGAPSLVPEEGFELHLHELAEGKHRIGPMDFTFCELPPAGNQGVRFTWEGTTVALTGDSEFHPQELAFLRGVDLAVVDAGHPTESELVELAIRTRIPRIICTHLYGELDGEVLNARASREGYGGELVVGEDGFEFSLEDASSTTPSNGSVR